MAAAESSRQLWPMFDLLDAVLMCLELGNCWRLVLCVAGSLALGAIIFSHVASRSLSFALAVPVVAVGTIGGVIWEYRNRQEH